MQLAERILDMQCIKTGCDVYVEQYGEWVHGDAYREGGLLIVRSAGEDREAPFGPMRHFTVQSVAQWWDRPGSMNRSSTLVADQWQCHGYNGLPLDGEVDAAPEFTTDEVIELIAEGEELSPDEREKFRRQIEGA